MNTLILVIALAVLAVWFYWMIQAAVRAYHFKHDFIDRKVPNKQRIQPAQSEHIDFGDIQAHRQTARHGIEPYRSQSIAWLNRHSQ